MTPKHVAGLVQVLRRIRIELGETVAIVGEGTDASLIAELSRLAGAAIVQQFVPSQLNEAASASADAVLYAAQGWGALAEALRLARDKGRMLLVNPGGPAVDFNIYPDMHRRSLQVIGAEPSVPDASALRLSHYLLESGKLNTAGQSPNDSMTQ